LSRDVQDRLEAVSSRQVGGNAKGTEVP